MKPIRLRDFVRAENCYFSVVGYENQRKVKCFLRYVPGGSRAGYRKLSYDEAITQPIAEKYLQDGIFYIPHHDIDEVYKPEERISEIVKEDEDVKKVVEFFKSIPLGEMGVTGSRLIGLQNDESDVDFVIYGKSWFKGREMLKKGIESGKLEEPDYSMWDFIYRKRKVPLPFDVFISHERRKYHRGIVSSTYFDLLYVRGYNELNGVFPEEKGEKIERAVVIAKLLDDRFTFDYPAYYPVGGEIKAVLSFTHTYTGQVVKGETFEARGVVEKIGDEKYLIVGTKREAKNEYIVSLDFLECCGLLNEFRRWKM